MKKYITLSSALLSMAITSTLSASIIVDFTTAGPNSNVAGTGSFTFTTQDPTGTGVTFDIVVSALNAGGGQNGGDVAQRNAGLGSTVENSGTFLNVINGVSEDLVFNITNVVGLAAGESLVVTNLLSQNGSSANADQSGGFGGTFGHAAVDSVTLTSDTGSTSVVNQSDAGDTGAILLAADSNNATTGNTFAHDAGNLDFASSFTLVQSDLAANNAVVIQGFEFAVIPVPEPSTSLLLGIGGISALLGRRKRA